MVDYIIPIGIAKNPVELQIHNDVKEEKPSVERVTIIGTGNYGIALGKRLINSEYEVLYGSRDPNEKYLSECFDGDDDKLFSVTTIADAWNRSHEIIFLAVAFRDDIYESIVNKISKTHAESSRFPKILVDISNRTEAKGELDEGSNAEKLQSLINASDLKGFNIQVVKGFNLISAYTLGIGQIESLSHTGGILGLNSLNYQL